MLNDVNARVRKAAKALLPPRAIHAYRYLRHIALFPFEPEIKLVREFLDPTKIAIDVGADVGLYTSILAARSAHTIAIEPNPNSAECLRSLRLTRCEVIEAAASNVDGNSSLRVPHKDKTEYRALGSLSDRNPVRSASYREYKVRTVALDSLLATRPVPVSLIKIDVEGYELAVLEGAAETIKAHRPVLLIEIEFRHGSDVERVFEFLTARGYKAAALLNGVLTPVEAKGLANLQTDDLLRVKEAHPRFTGYVNNVIFRHAVTARGA